MIRAYKSSGGGLASESEAASMPAYANQLQALQELLDRGVLSRVDVLKQGTTDLLGSLVAHEDPLKKKLAHIMLSRQISV